MRFSQNIPNIRVNIFFYVPNNLFLTTKNVSCYMCFYWDILFLGTGGVVKKWAYILEFAPTTRMQNVDVTGWPRLTLDVAKVNRDSLKKMLNYNERGGRCRCFVDISVMHWRFVINTFCTCSKFRQLRYWKYM